MHTHMHIHLQLLWGSGKLTTVSSKHHSSGTTILIPSSYSSGSHNHKPTLTAISAAMVFSSSSTWTICPRYHKPQPSTAILHHNGDHGISFGQKAFITTILKRCHMQNAHVISTPMVSNIELDIADDRGEKELDKESVKHYYAIVGSLMYAAFATRPDISYALCRYNSRPFTSHMIAANRVLQYLNATAYFRLHFHDNGNCNDGHCWIYRL